MSKMSWNGSRWVPDADPIAAAEYAKSIASKKRYAVTDCGLVFVLGEDCECIGTLFDQPEGFKY